MRARLLARYGPEEGLEVEFGAEATIGRGKENSVPLSSREVSQHHARVFFDPDSTAYWVEDLGSLNGTLVDGEPVSGRRRLAGLHVLSFGAAAELFFVELDTEAEERQEPETVPVDAAGSRTRVDAEAPTLPPALEAPPAREGTRVEHEMPTLPVDLRAGDEPEPEAGVEETPVAAPSEPAAAARAARFFLEVGGADGGRFELRDGDNLVGRSGRARVVLANRELSRRHATLRVAGDRVWVRDEGSRNHTWVGDREISEEVELEPGSELRFGRLVARLVAADGGERGGE